MSDKDIKPQTQEQINEFLGVHELTTEAHIVKKQTVETIYHFKYTSDEIVLVDAGVEGKFLKIRYTADDRRDGKDILYLTPSFLKIITKILKENPDLLKEDEL